jgi:hypothetical protein
MARCGKRSRASRLRSGQASGMPADWKQVAHPSAQALDRFIARLGLPRRLRDGGVLKRSSRRRR